MASDAHLVAGATRGSCSGHDAKVVSRVEIARHGVTGLWSLREEVRLTDPGEDYKCIGPISTPRIAPIPERVYRGVLDVVAGVSSRLIQGHRLRRGRLVDHPNADLAMVHPVPARDAVDGLIIDARAAAASKLGPTSNALHRLPD